jgi:alkylation response protein AidB-like acyl-CoA dehydrogenase
LSTAASKKAGAPDSGAQILIEHARRFADQVIRPQAAHWERERRMPTEAIMQAARLGLCGIEVPVDQGGRGEPFSVKCRISRILAAADYAFAFSVINTQNVAAKLAHQAPPSLASRYVPDLIAGTRLGCTALTEPGMGSDFSAITTQARRIAGGWRLNGRKAWITNAAAADVVILYAQTEPGSGASGIAGFLVDAQRAGFVREPPFALAGQHAIGAGGFTLADYEARDEEMLQPPGQAFKAALTSINGARTYVAAMCCGMVQEAIDVAAAWGETRRSFGAALADHQGWRWYLAQASAELAGCELMVEKASQMIDAGEDAQMIAAQAKLMSTRMAERQLAALAQAMGAEGLREQHPFGRHLVAARVASFTDGSSEMLLERIAAGLRREKRKR